MFSLACLLLLQAHGVYSEPLWAVACQIHTRNFLHYAVRLKPTIVLYCENVTDSKLFFFCTCAAFSCFQHALLSVIGLRWDGNVHDCAWVSCRLRGSSPLMFSFLFDPNITKVLVSLFRTFSVFSSHLVCMLCGIWQHAAPGWPISPAACLQLTSFAPIRPPFISTLLFSSPGPQHPLLPWFQLKQELTTGCQAKHFSPIIH